MKIFLRTLPVLLFPAFVFSQNMPGCGFNKAYDYLFSTDKDAKARLDKRIAESNNESKLAAQDGAKTASASYTIPVVFHILHKGGSENISDAQIFDQVAILNRDYQKLNSDTVNIVSQFKNLAANSSIQFVLASIDENGKCTNGITRHYDNRTNWTVDFSNYVYTWDPSKYLNVYVVKTMPSGIAGYAYLPGTVSANADAIVILNGYVGSIGTSSGYTSRALTHEVGHWFNLQHTWGSTNNPGVACGDDGVSDTPVTKGHSFCNLSNGVDCTPGVTENIQNYMEYAYCSNMFTIGQKDRMHNCLNSPVANRNNLSSFSNLVATGVLNPPASCPPTAEFVTSTSITCVGNSLAFLDYSYNTPPTSWLWSSNLASNTSTMQNGILTFANSGIASVKLVASNVNGSDSVTKQNVIVMAGAGSGSTNVTQSFETTFPDNNWVISQPQFGSSFQQTGTAAATGTNSIWVNNYYDNPNGTVALFSPAFDMVNSVSAQLSFKYAYAQQASTNADQLKVSVSTNCGTSWSQVFLKSGAQLSTTGSLVTQAFNSPSAAQWTLASVSLNSFSGASKMYIRFEFTPDPNGAGNNFFLEDINISNIVSVKENSGGLDGISVYPNPFSNEIMLKSYGINGPVNLRMYDVSSRLVYSSTIENPENEVKLKDFSGFTAGIYFLKIESGKGSKTIKLVKQ